MDIQSHAHLAQVGYQNLLRLHLDDAAAGFIGPIQERTRNGRVNNRRRRQSKLGQLAFAAGAMPA